MGPEQRKLARHALGLPNQQNRTYRNRHASHRNHPAWEAMVAADEAEADRSEEKMVWYHLTKAGATAALDPQEKLDPEDFPA